MFPDPDEVIQKAKPPESPFKVDLPKEHFNTWAKAAVSVTSPSVLVWVAECQALVDQHFGAKIFSLRLRSIKDFIWITMDSTTTHRVFAFIAKRTGDIHCPAIYDEPFADPHGHITDPATRMSIMSAWGVQTLWSWLPTFPDGRHFQRKP